MSDKSESPNPADDAAQSDIIDFDKLGEAQAPER